MVRNRTFCAVSLLGTILLNGCASYAPSPARLDPSGSNVTKGVAGDLTVYVEEYGSSEKEEKAFDASLVKESVLPVLILVENAGKEPYELKVADISVKGATALRPLTPEEAAGRAKRAALPRALGWSLIVPIISIPIAVAASAIHTSKVNEQIVRDFAGKAFENGSIAPNKSHTGFLFFELDPGRKDLAGLFLELAARNAVTGERVTVVIPLPSATFKAAPESSTQSPTEGPQGSTQR